MKSYTLNIARYNIRLESSEVEPDLLPNDRFMRNITDNQNFDIVIRVHNGNYKLPEEAERVFVAPYTVEVKGNKIQRKENFWSVYKKNHDLYIVTNFPDSPSNKKAVLKFSLFLRDWDLWIENGGPVTDPLEYPIDGLVLYYLTAINADIMIHASGICYDGIGYMFSGASGQGKSTMARLWDNIGAQVIHDDRLIIRNIDGTYMMFNTPVYENDYPSEAPLSRIYLIGHGTGNRAVAERDASAVTHIIANCIQHNYDPEMIARFLGSVSMMCSKIPVSTLTFKPDRSIIEYILRNEGE